MPYTFTLIATIPATPDEIYEAWLDSHGHSAMTGARATMSDHVGADVSAWDGYITGRNLELIPGARIVQSWRTSKFDDDHEDSVITVTLEPAGDDALLTLGHANVPDGQTSYEDGGWQSNYFEPMIAYFTALKARIEDTEPEPDGVVPEPDDAAPKQRAQRTRAAQPTPAAEPRRAATPGKAKRAARAEKSKPSATRAKAAPKKTVSKARVGKTRSASTARSANKPRAVSKARSASKARSTNKSRSVKKTRGRKPTSGRRR